MPGQVFDAKPLEDPKIKGKEEEWSISHLYNQDLRDHVLPRQIIEELLAQP